MCTLKRSLSFCFVILMVFQFQKNTNAESLTAGELSNHCLAICDFLYSEGIPMNEIHQPDVCLGYLKSAISVVKLFPPTGLESSTKRCASLLTSDRTAKSVDEDNLMLTACRFGKWISERSSFHNRPASFGVMKWSEATGCK